MSEGEKLPGGPVQQKPVEIDGRNYDPLNPPKMVKKPDGSIEWRGGTQQPSSGDEEPSTEETEDVT